MRALHHDPCGVLVGRRTFRPHLSRVACLGLAVLVAVACGGPADRQPDTAGRSETPLAAGPEEVAPSARIQLGQGEAPERGIGIGEGAIWVGAHRAPLVFRVDPSTNRLVARIRVPDSVCAIATALDTVWVTHCFGGRDGVSLIDPETNEVRTMIRGPRAPGLAFGAGSLWVSEFDEGGGSVRRIDPRTTKVLAKVRVAAEPIDVGFGFGSVWVVSRAEGIVSRIDPSSDRVVATIPVGDPQGPFHPMDLAVGEGAVWVPGTDYRLYRIDPSTNEATGINVGAQDPGGWGSMTVTAGLGSIWMRTAEDMVSRIDPTTHEVIGRFSFGAAVVGIVTGHHALWAAAPDTGELLRLTPQRSVL